ncbi:hypothetical protein TNCV_70831 [Trichonephila clavipes]|nr:hypothetical protein TNCV_70831 [Trichonephila clavipes]
MRVPVCNAKMAIKYQQDRALLYRLPPPSCLASRRVFRATRTRTRDTSQCRVRGHNSKRSWPPCNFEPWSQMRRMAPELELGMAILSEKDRFLS